MVFGSQFSVSLSYKFNYHIYCARMCPPACRQAGLTTGLFCHTAMLWNVSGSQPDFSVILQRFGMCPVSNRTNFFLSTDRELSIGLEDRKCMAEKSTSII